MNRDIILIILALWPILGAGLSYLTGRRDKQARDYLAMAVCILEFLLIVWLFVRVSAGEVFTLRINDICGRGLSFKMDGFRALYSGIAALMWMMTTLFSKEYFTHYHNRNRYYLFLLVTFGSTVGVFLSADLFTTFIFFEIMSLASYVMVIHDEKPAAMRAGATYITVAVLGGMVMLMGLFLLYHTVGTLDMDLLLDACRSCRDKRLVYTASALLLFGFGAKAGMFPLHIWLPKAHPVAPAPASALLSGILTKTGVFGVLVIGSCIMLHDQNWGFFILCIGVVTMFLGAFLAVFSIDLKRTLACSSMSQIGFILIGAGMQGLLGHHNALAVRGTILHMVNHSLLKLVLFIAAGVIFMNLHKTTLNDIQGFGRGKPLLHVSFLMGTLGITGVPFWNGYISKTLLHESIVEFLPIVGGIPVWSNFFRMTEVIFLISGGLTVTYMLKLYIAVFINRHPDQEAKMDSFNGRYMNRLTTFALTVPAVLLPILGMYPSATMDQIASVAQSFMHGEEPAHAVSYFSWVNLQGALISLGFGVVVYAVFIREYLIRRDENGYAVYVDRWPSWLDLENLIYRPLLLHVLPFLGALPARICDCLVDVFILLGNRTVFNIARETHKIKEFAFMREGTKLGMLRREISNSLSFSLLLFCLGLCGALVYMLVV